MGRRIAGFWRGLAQQSPRVPALGLPWAAVVAIRPGRLRHPSIRTPGIGERGVSGLACYASRAQYAHCYGSWGNKPQRRVAPYQQPIETTAPPPGRASGWVRTANVQDRARWAWMTGHE